MSKKTFVLDARLPVSEGTSTDDPNHPKNITKGLMVVQNQALADTKYDIYPPPREGFTNPESNKTNVFIACVVIIVTLTIVVVSTSTYLRIACIVVLLFFINYAIYKLENRIV